MAIPMLNGFLSNTFINNNIHPKGKIQRAVLPTSIIKVKSNPTDGMKMMATGFPLPQENLLPGKKRSHAVSSSLGIPRMRGNGVTLH